MKTSKAISHSFATDVEYVSVYKNYMGRIELWLSDDEQHSDGVVVNHKVKLTINEKATRKLHERLSKVLAEIDKEREE